MSSIFLTLDFGNLIENDKRTFTYDYQNRLIEANLKDNHEGSQDSYKIKYSYDPLGRRTSKRVYQGANENRAHSVFSGILINTLNL